MPVSINGNTGVVTGLAVGGLPDGTVDADTLASNAVRLLPQAGSTSGGGGSGGPGKLKKRTGDKTKEYLEKALAKTRD